MEPRKSLALACAYFDDGRCRSCALLDVAYPDQLTAKQARARALVDPFAPAAASVEWRSPVASEPGGFRIKAKMVVGGTVDAPTLGILDAQHHGVDLSDCPIVDPAIDAALPAFAAFITAARLVPYDVNARRGELKHVIVTVSAAGELMARFVLRSTESLARIRKQLPGLIEAVPGLRVVTANLLPGHVALLEGEEELVLTDADALRYPLNDLALNLLPRSFVQTNAEVAAALYREGAQWVAETAPATVWDLYCGVGGFALHIARRLGELRVPGAAVAVTGVEVSRDAVESGRRAAAEAHLDAHFVAADATAWALAQPAAPGLVIVNPPRRGIGPALAGWLEGSGVDRVLYSSCNAESLAADLAAMPSLKPVRARVFDMFPHTGHFETLVLLERR